MFSWFENLNENLYIKQEQDRKQKIYIEQKKVNKNMVYNSRDRQGHGIEYKG